MSATPYEWQSRPDFARLLGITDASVVNGIKRGRIETRALTTEERATSTEERKRAGIKGRGPTQVVRLRADLTALSVVPVVRAKKRAPRAPKPQPTEPSLASRGLPELGRILPPGERPLTALGGMLVFKTGCPQSFADQVLELARIAFPSADTIHLALSVDLVLASASAPPADPTTPEGAPE